MDTSNLKNEVLDFLKDIIIIVIVVMFVKTFFVSPFQIKWQSMYDSYYDWQFIIVDRFSYLELWDIKKWLPERWDVVVFKPKVSEDKEFFIKRVIGIPGDTLKIEDGKVYLKITGQSEFAELNEWYLSDVNMDATFVSWKFNSSSKTKKNIYEVPEWSYFVMWDNRAASTDSRTCFYSCSADRSNFIKKKDISGKLFIDLWYFNLKDFSFTHPKLWINTFPTFFWSPDSYDYSNK